MEREKQIHCLPPTGDRICNLGKCPNQGFNLQPFGVWDNALTQPPSHSDLNCHIFSDYKMHLPSPPPFWEEKGGVSYSPNVAYLACCGGGGFWGGGFPPYFPPLKPRYILWSCASYSPQTTVFSNLLVNI